MSERYTAYFDGACGPPNPGGPAAYGAIVLLDGVPIWECSKPYAPPVGYRTSNNVAEYAGLIALLCWFVDNSLTAAPIYVYGDSNLVINQTFGTWRIKGGFYAPLARHARVLKARFTDIRGKWIPREQNTVADELSQRAMPAKLRDYDWSTRPRIGTSVY